MTSKKNFILFFSITTLLTISLTAVYEAIPIGYTEQQRTALNKESLAQALKGNHLELIAMFLPKTNTEAVNPQYVPTLTNMHNYTHGETLQIVIQKSGLKPNAFYNKTFKDNMDMLPALHDAGAEIKYRENSLHLTTQFLQLKALQFLLNRGFDPNKKFGCFKTTPLDKTFVPQRSPETRSKGKQAALILLRAGANRISSNSEDYFAQSTDYTLEKQAFFNEVFEAYAKQASIQTAAKYEMTAAIIQAAQRRKALSEPME